MTKGTRRKGVSYAPGKRDVNSRLRSVLTQRLPRLPRELVARAPDPADREGALSMLAMNCRESDRVGANQTSMAGIEHPGEASAPVTRPCSCGSDLHLHGRTVPDRRVGMTVGLAFCGTVEKAGAEILRLVEIDGVPAVLGTSATFSGPSGTTRRAAVRRGENS